MDPIESYLPNENADGSQARDVSTKKFRSTECSQCHQLLPKNLLLQHRMSVVSGGSSGSHWTSSVTDSANAKGKWQPNRISAGRRRGHSSGRTYYKAKDIWLCSSCNANYLEQIEQDRQSLINFVIYFVVVVIVIVASYKLYCTIADTPPVPAATTDRESLEK
jgi:hypothetical protein